ncbi:unnamed protein product [Leptidea sinapis]|uniref:Hakai C2H2 zinc finger domain-containing protein n=1 Tax=Leptidea sinapis TaxID=189913 RepID=A0A5E4QM77_9NEOP|nr:unnamed protein product [Leptidea sinapis]
MCFVLRVEQTGLGTVFMCTHSGTRYGNTGCRRTYLSQRDLQAHINHRHVSSGGSEKPAARACARRGRTSQHERASSRA